VAVDSDGNAYVTGFTASANFPITPAAFQPLFARGLFDVFVTKVHSSGSFLVYSTYLGGGGEERGAGIAVDSSGNALVTGFTGSTDFPTTPDALQPTFGGGSPFIGDAFVTKLDAAGAVLVYSSYLGGTDGDAGKGIAVDTADNAYVTGHTGSSNFPTTPRAFQPTGGGLINGSGNVDAFVAKFGDNPLSTRSRKAPQPRSASGRTTVRRRASSAAAASSRQTSPPPPPCQLHRNGGELDRRQVQMSAGRNGVYRRRRTDHGGYVRPQRALAPSPRNPSSRLQVLQQRVTRSSSP